MKHIMYLLIACLLGGLLLAETSTASICDPKETVIFFGNGIKSVEKNAYDSRNIIEQRLQAQLSPDEFKLLEFDLAYNETHSLPLDLLEASIQLLTNNVSRFWRIYWGHEMMPDWFGDKLILLTSLIDKSALVTTDSLKDHVTTYRTRIDEGKRVLLVAHSQGNLFGNQAYNQLNESDRRSFAMVAVANVDNTVIGADSPYTTLETDRVVQALIAAQLLLPTKPMEPNTLNQPDSGSGDFLGHEFIQSYLAENSISGDQIIQQIVGKLDSLYTPPEFLKSGVITVTLTWGQEPDMDLHVFEPNGTHVYWLNQEGYSGELDHDDRSGHGPEHYTVPTCETLEYGTYEIGLDYFKGYGPEVGTVHIQAGHLIRTYEIPMGSEYYGDSNYPVIIANISVRNNENGVLEFTVF